MHSRKSPSFKQIYILVNIQGKGKVIHRVKQPLRMPLCALHYEHFVSDVEQIEHFGEFHPIPPHPQSSYLFPYLHAVWSWYVWTGSWSVLDGNICGWGSILLQCFRQSHRSPLLTEASLSQMLVLVFHTSFYIYFFYYLHTRLTSMHYYWPFFLLLSPPYPQLQYYTTFPILTFQALA